MFVSKYRPIEVIGPKKVVKLMDKIPKIAELSSPMEETNILRPSYAFSWASLRDLVNIYMHIYV